MMAGPVACSPWRPKASPVADPSKPLHLGSTWLLLGPLLNLETQYTNGEEYIPITVSKVEYLDNHIGFPYNKMYYMHI